MSSSDPADSASGATGTSATVTQSPHGASEAAGQATATSAASTPLLMQIVVRKDLLEVSLVTAWENYALSQ